MVDGLLGCERPLVEAAEDVRNAVPEDVPKVTEAPMVLRLLEKRQRRARTPLDFVDRLVSEQRPRKGGDRESQGLSWAIPGLVRPHRDPLGVRRSLLRRHLLIDELELEANVESHRPDQLERTLDQRPRCSTIAAPHGTATSRG